MKDKNNIHQVYLALGSNLGNKAQNIELALKNIGIQVGKIVATSSLYETKPEGFESTNDFVNAACLVETELLPLQILERTQAIEREMGRKSKSVDATYSDRIIDIDLLFFDNEVCKHPTLTLPHPQIQQRMFVLAPLAEIASELTHPVLKKTIKQLKQNLEYEKM